MNIFMRICVLVVLTATLVSCGKSSTQFMKDIKVQTSTQNDDVYLSLEAKLNFGNMQVPQVSFPINNPKTGQNLGALDMGPLAGGQNYLKISANLSELTPLQASGGELPNGNSLPLIASNQVVGINIGGSANIKLYVSFVDGAYAIGVAVPIKAFDGIGGSVGATSIFPIFNIGGVVGSAGLFTSPNKGQNGFGVFVDLTSVIDQIGKRSLQGQSAHMATSARSVRALSVQQAPKGELDYRSLNTSRSKKKKVDKMIYRLHRKRAKLRLW